MKKDKCVSCHNKITNMQYSSSDERYEEVGNFCIDCLMKINENIRESTPTERRYEAGLSFFAV